VLGSFFRFLVRPLLPHLRQQWRADAADTRRKIEDRVDRDIKAVADRVKREHEALGDQRTQLTDVARTAAELEDRLKGLEQQVRVLRTTLAINTEHRERRHAAAVFEPAHICAHVTDAIARAPMSVDPTPHVVIERLLPEDSYRALLDALPPRFFFTHGPKMKPDLKLSRSDVAPEWTHLGVAFIEETLVPQMVQPLLRRFEPHMPGAYAERYGAELGPRVAAVPHEASGGRLMVRRPGYHLDPHLDPKRALVSCLIYFARPGDSEAYGTQLFRIDARPQIDQTSTFYPERAGYRCELVKTVPFRPNSAVAFLNAGAAHGADIPASAPDTTERYSYQFYVSAEPSALAVVVGA
jgi:hypothetical protein